MGEARRKIPDRLKHVSVELEPGGEAVAEALRSAGFVAGEAPWARVVVAGEDGFEAVSRDVAWVLAGGVLAICGGTGPLLAALHLTPGAGAVSGPLEAAPGAPSLPLASAWPVTGVGYALYRAGETCVALAGRRGDGWVVYVGTPEPSLIAACVAWVAAQGRSCPPN
jgi:hypothetical protein